MANPTHIENKLKNINVDGVENCNLLCKLIIDYLPSKNCLIKGAKADNTSAPPIISQKEINYIADTGQAVDKSMFYSYLEIPPGSFINYRDTSYEATQMVFFRPSRHTIDNERFDFEVNIHHGTFLDKDLDRRGIVSHAHYKSNTKAGKTYNMDYHYHTNETKDDQEPPHEDTYVPESKKNMVTCILFNISDHQGTNTNVFFNQFINNESFKHRDFKNYPLNIKTHEGWSIEDLLPKRRSFFIYDDNNNTKNNTYIVFDSINSIDKGIVDILKHHTFKPEPQADDKFLTGTNISTILYKSNIEVITDSKYKQQMREQIKQLLGIHRTSMRISDPLGSSKEFNESAAKLYQKVFSGSYRNYRDDVGTAKLLTEAWKEWGKGKMVETKISRMPLESHDDIFDNDGKVKSSKVAKYADIKFNPADEYLKEFEKQNNSRLTPLLNSSAEQYRNLNDFREILYRFNIQITNVVGQEFSDSKKTVLLEELGIQKLNTEMSITDLFMLLNMVQPPPNPVDIYITGYEGNYNFYVGNLSGFENINLESSKLKQVDNLLYVPNISEDLNQTSDKEVLYTEKVVLIKYTVKFMGNTLVEFLGGLGTGTDIDKISKASPLTFDNNNFPELYRLMIQTDSSLKYTGAHNLLDYQFVTVLDSGTDQKAKVTKCIDKLKTFCERFQARYNFTNLIKIHKPGVPPAAGGSATATGTATAGDTAIAAATAAATAAAKQANTYYSDIVAVSGAVEDAITNAAADTDDDFIKIITTAASSSTKDVAALAAAAVAVVLKSYPDAKQEDATAAITVTVAAINDKKTTDAAGAAPEAAKSLKITPAAAAANAAVVNSAYEDIARAAATHAAANSGASAAANAAKAAAAANAAATSIFNSTKAAAEAEAKAAAAAAAEAEAAEAAAAPHPLYNMYQIIIPQGILHHFILKIIKENLPASIQSSLTVLNTGYEFNTTINGDVCQNWNSHQVHHEGGFWDSFRKVPKYPREGRAYDLLTKQQMDFVKHGLVEAVEEDDKDEAGNPIKVVKMIPHNKCRNPGNSKSAPWCYTKNPNKRWDYCVKPDHSHRFAKIVLLITTLMFIIIAYVTVKMIFKKQYFTEFIARLTGGTAAGGQAGATG